MCYGTTQVCRAWEPSNKRQKCHWTKNTNTTTSVTTENNQFSFWLQGKPHVCLCVTAYVCARFLALSTICHGEVRRAQSGRLQFIIESDSEYWKDVVVEINFQHGTQTPRSTELKVISCWLHKMYSIDSRPCGCRQIVWLIAMCWKIIPALCIIATTDMQGVNFGHGSLPHSKQLIGWVCCLSWTWI